eukprot:augustus_masked-scaffold_15-processed-gene-7.70-mRNA-1 protein AED:0.02 eAED:0.02 QI:0/-1/0/1/-1/1/1/0/578
MFKFTRTRKRNPRKRRNVRTVSTLRRGKKSKTKPLLNFKVSSAVSSAAEEVEATNHGKKRFEVFEEATDFPEFGTVGRKKSGTRATFDDHNENTGFDDTFMPRNTFDSNVSHYLDPYVDPSQQGVPMMKFSLDEQMSRGYSFSSFNRSTGPDVHRSVSKNSNTLSFSTVSEDSILQGDYSVISRRSMNNPVYVQQDISSISRSKKKKRGRSKGKIKSSLTRTRSRKKLETLREQGRNSTSRLTIERTPSRKDGIDSDLRRSNKSVEYLRKSSKNLGTEANFQQLEDMIKLAEKKRKTWDSHLKLNATPIALEKAEPVKKVERVEKVKKKKRKNQDISFKLTLENVEPKLEKRENDFQLYSPASETIKSEFVAYLNDAMQLSPSSNVRLSLKDKFVRKIPGSTFCEIKTDYDGTHTVEETPTDLDSHLISYRLRKLAKRISIRKSLRSLKSFKSLASFRSNKGADKELRLRSKMAKFVSDPSLDRPVTPPRKESNSKLDRIEKKKARAKKYKEKIDIAKKDSFDSKESVTCKECGKKEFLNKKKTKQWVDEYCVKCYKRLYGIRGYKNRLKEIEKDLSV